jgi:hypothetical protein
MIAWKLSHFNQGSFVKLRTNLIYNIGLHFFPTCLHSLLFGGDVSQSGVMAFCHGYSWWWCWVWHFVSGGTHKVHDCIPLFFCGYFSKSWCGTFLCCNLNG